MACGFLCAETLDLVAPLLGLLLKLLRLRGLYSLHAAGVVTPQGESLLIVGDPGHGESTLAIGLIRRGWGNLSDGAVLLRQQPGGVEAFACRKYVYVNADAAGNYADLPVGEEVPDYAGGRKGRVYIATVFPEQRQWGCRPCVLLFSHIVARQQSALVPLERRTALGHLLAQSGSQPFDRCTMAQHLAVLTCLVQQSVAYELRAGLGVYQEPSTLVQSRRTAGGAG